MKTEDKHDWRAELLAAMQEYVPPNGVIVCAIDTSDSISTEMLMQKMTEISTILQDADVEYWGSDFAVDDACSNALQGRDPDDYSEE